MGGRGGRARSGWDWHVYLPSLRSTGKQPHLRGASVGNKYLEEATGLTREGRPRHQSGLVCGVGGGGIVERGRRPSWVWASTPKT